MASAASRNNRPGKTSNPAPLIGAVFGLLWASIGLAGLSGPNAGTVRWTVVAVAVGVLVIAVTCRHAGNGGETVHRLPRPEPRISFTKLIVLQAVLIGVGRELLNTRLHQPHLVYAWSAIVVGAHFLPLARNWAAPSLRVLGAGMMLVGLATGLVVLTHLRGAPDGLWMWLPGLGCAALLWLAALASALRRFA